MKKALCIISGGMDSTTCAYIAKEQGYDLIAVHFDYGQRTEKKERECFLQICKILQIQKYFILDTHFIAQIGGSALTDTNLQIRKNSLNKDMPNTYVPFRNGIFLSIAGAIAEKENCEAIFIGVVEEDSSGYPDCTNEFIANIQQAINSGTSDNFNVTIKTPLINLTKTEIVQKAVEMDVRLEYTWSCYENNDEACGVCDSCLLRLNGFHKANINDKIKYKKS